MRLDGRHAAGPGESAEKRVRLFPGCAVLQADTLSLKIPGPQYAFQVSPRNIGDQ